MKIENYINDAVNEENEEREHKVRQRVKHLVADIMSEQQKLQECTKNIVEYKKELKAMQLPASFELEM